MENASPNLYDAIGVGADASSDKIKKKTRKLIHEVRESNKTNSAKNELIRFFKSARETLCDARARREYDSSIGIVTVGTDDSADPEISSTESLIPFETMQPFRQPFGVLGALGSLGSLGSLGRLGELVRPLESSSPPPSPLSSSPSAALAGFGFLGTGIEDMFSSSIIPDELSSSAGRSLKPGTFHILEYTKVRNPGGGFDEFGFTRQGDTRNDRVTEKRFERKS